MPDDKFSMFRNRLLKVYRHIGKQARKQQVSCYRLYDHDLPEFPLCIEVYEANIYVAEYKRRHNMTEEAHDAWMEQTLEVVCEVLAVTREQIFLKLRQRKPGRLGQYQRIETEKNEFVVNENGLRFLVNLSDYLDTGLFLDHRLTRQMVREQSKGKRVLNLFAYTGSFSIYAAGGGASNVTTIDMSNTYINWARKNAELNKQDMAIHEFIQADVIQQLSTIPDAAFDIIVLDPPTFSNSKRMEEHFDVQRDHVFLVKQCLRILDTGGQLYFSTNNRSFELDENAIGIPAKNITRATTPFDFEGRLFRFCFLFNK